MSDEVTTLEVEDAPVVVVGDQGEPAPEPEETAADDDYDAGLAKALAKPEAKPETKPEVKPEPEGEKVRDAKGRFVKKDEEGEPTEEEEELRGKSILEQQEAEEKQTRAEQERAEAERREHEAREQAGKPPKYIPISQADADVYLQMASPELFKGQTIKIGDSEVALDEYVADNPEVTVIAGALINNFLSALVQKGLIATKDTVSQTISEHMRGAEEKAFIMDIRLHGVKDPVALSKHEKFPEWYKGQKPSIQALFRSKEASDHALGWKRFQRDLKLPGAEKKAEVDAKAREVKEKKDALFGSTIRSGQPSKRSAVEDDYDAGFDEARSKHVR